MEHILAQKIAVARVICKIPNNATECKVAWDQVEEYARAVRIVNMRKKQPPSKPYSELALRDYEC
jgi:hypothetical protein